MQAWGSRSPVAIVAILLLGGAVWPAAWADPGRPDERIQEAALRLNRTAAVLAEPAASERLAAAFHVRSRVVVDLHDQKLDFGEVAVVLALAEAGRISSDRILALWASARLDWGEIAERLRVDVAALLERLETVRGELALPQSYRSMR